MNIRILSFILLFAASLFVGSCKDDSELTVASMTAKIGETTWSATPAAVAATTYTDYLTVAGYNLDGQYMLISVRKDGGVTAGTYDFKAGLSTETSLETYAVYMEDKDDGEDGTKKYLTISGQVVITSITADKVSGTFNFVAKNKIETSLAITNGKFTNVPVIGGSEE